MSAAIGTNLRTDRKGAYNRHDAKHRHAKGDPVPCEAGRYHLHVALACPWAAGALAVVYLKGLEGVVSHSIVHPTWGKTKPDDDTDEHHGWVYRKPGDAPMTSPTGNGSFECDAALVPDMVTNVATVREVFELNGDTTGPFTTPLLWDNKDKRIVSNESTESKRDTADPVEKHVTVRLLSALYPLPVRLPDPDPRMLSIASTRASCLLTRFPRPRSPALALHTTPPPHTHLPTPSSPSSSTPTFTPTFTPASTPAPASTPTAPAVLRIFNSEWNDLAGNPGLDLYPAEHEAAMVELNDRLVYPRVNNGVYVDAGARGGGGGGRERWIMNAMECHRMKVCIHVWQPCCCYCLYRLNSATPTQSVFVHTTRGTRT